MKLNKIKRVKLTAKVVDMLEDFIQENTFKPGDKLPSERVLAEQLGIGRSSLRESLRFLEAREIIQVLPGKGIFVVGENELAATRNALSRITDKKATLLELLQVRTPLTILAAELAAVNATDEHIREMEARLQSCEQRYAAGEEGGSEDRLFHQAIDEASGNSLLPMLSNIIFETWIDHDFGTENAFLETVPLHRPMFEAIRNHDPKGASKAAKRLMKLTEKIVFAQQKTA